MSNLKFHCTFELNGKPMSELRVGATRFAAFSGGGSGLNSRSSACSVNTGPIPPGRYYIFDRQSGGLLGQVKSYVTGRDEWFALHAVDAKIDDQMLCNQVSRGQFRLHPKGPLGISMGCIVLDKHIDFGALRRLLTSVPPVSVPGSVMKAYGTVDVR